MTGSKTTSHSIGFSANSDEIKSGSIVIVGAGLAGLFTALKLAPTPVTIVSAAKLGKGAASAWAQGGIAAAVGQNDSVIAHAHDTIAAGAGLVDPDIATMVAKEAPARIYDLLDYGVPFDQKDDGQFILSREAAHSQNRIVRVSGDKAGAAIMQTLIERVRRTPSIQILEGFELEDLILTNGSVSGVKLAQETRTDTIHYEIHQVSALVLATGGIGALYAVTTNPAYSRGTALAIAARAGAVISDAEFVQFHPTALDFGQDPVPLATESLRGEGAQLIDSNGDPFMSKLHPDGDLAPRDIVTRGVFAQNQNGRGAFLDCRTAIGENFANSFPTVFKSCEKAGYNPQTQPLPVTTAAHYHMGGIATDLRARSSIPGLWAVGEVAATGLHGANRLASNSLLETLVFGDRAARDIATLFAKPSAAYDQPMEHLLLKRVSSPNTRLEDTPARETAIQKMRNIMSHHVGVIRNKQGLMSALHDLEQLQETFNKDKLITNMALAARFVVVASLYRKESRGAHFRSDFPKQDSTIGKRSFLTLADVETVSALYARNKICQSPSCDSKEKDKQLAIQHV